ncbi:response regulator [Thermodesulfobacteriota bacterium]
MKNAEVATIIIADYKLPGINGLDFLEQIQKLYPYAIRILISAFGNDEVVYKAKALGIQYFIEKPFTSGTIEEPLTNVFETCKKINLAKVEYF